MIAADSLIRPYGDDSATLRRHVGALVGAIDAIAQGYTRLLLTDIRDDGAVVGFAGDWLRTPLHDPFWDCLQIVHNAYRPSHLTVWRVEG